MTEEEIRAQTDDELRTTVMVASDEIEKRRKKARIPEQMKAMNEEFLKADGRGPGEPWAQPEGAHDAYPKDWPVTHSGKEWLSEVEVNVWEPGVSGWRQKVEEGAAPAEFVQPTGAHDAYDKDEAVTFEGSVYVSKVDNNAYSPTAYPPNWTLQN